MNVAEVVIMRTRDQWGSDSACCGHCGAAARPHSSFCARCGSAIQGGGRGVALLGTLGLIVFIVLLLNALFIGLL